MSTYTTIRDVLLNRVPLVDDPGIDGEPDEYGQIEVRADYALELSDGLGEVLGKVATAVRIVRYAPDDDGDRRSTSLDLYPSELAILRDLLAEVSA